MKNKMTKILLSAAAVFGIFMELGWGFFSLIVRCTKREKAEKKKRWKNLKHAQVNHPRYKFEEQYEAGKAWCAEQPMQDRYIKSHDGLRLHAKYLPAKAAKRTVLLAHGYKGSGFGDFANMAKFLHENQCNLLFIDQRCCGESEGNYISFGAMEKWDVQRWVYDL